MPVSSVVLEVCAAALLEVDERQQAILDVQVVEDQRVLDGQVYSEEDLHGYLSPNSRGLVRLKG